MACLEWRARHHYAGTSFLKRKMNGTISVRAVTASAPGAVSAYGTVADHAEVSPDSKPSISSTPRSGCG